MESRTRTSLRSEFGNKFLIEDAPDNEMPAGGMVPLEAMRLIGEEIVLDGIPERNLATFVTTWMEPEAQRIIAENLHRNFIDHAEYPQTAEIEQRCIRMLANLFNAPGETTGARTQGSSEAIMLGALSLKWNWRQRTRGGRQGHRQAQPRLRRQTSTSSGRSSAATSTSSRGSSRCSPTSTRSAPRTCEPHVDENTIGVAAVARHDLHRPRRRHRRDQRPPRRAQGREGPRRAAARRRRQRRLRLAVPLPRLRVGLPARAGALDQRLRPQVRARLPGHRLADLPREGGPRRGPRLLRELPRQGRTRPSRSTSRPARRWSSPSTTR